MSTQLFDDCTAAAHCYKELHPVWQEDCETSIKLPLPEVVVKADRPMPPFGCCSDIESVAVKRVQLSPHHGQKNLHPNPANHEENLYRVCLEVCLRNYLSTYPLVASVKDYHHKNQISNCKSVTVNDNGEEAVVKPRYFSIVSEFVEGVPLSQFQLPTNPEAAEATFRWIMCQLICLVHHMALHGWNHLAFGGSWHLDNFIVDTQTGNLKLVDFGLQGATVEQLDLGDDELPPLPGVRELLGLWTSSIQGFDQIASTFSPLGQAMVHSGAASIGADLRSVLMVQFFDWWAKDANCSALVTATLDEVKKYSDDKVAKPALFSLLAGLKEGSTDHVSSAYLQKLDCYLHEAAELWLFGYGSLLWKQNFEFVGRPEESYIKGYVRLFTQGSTDHRGVPGKPGRCVTLEPTPTDPDARVYGLVFRVAESTKHEALTALDIRERSGYERHMLVTYPHDDQRTTIGGVELPSFPFPSLVYIANTENEEYLGMESIEKLAANIYHSVGKSGPNKDYLLNMVDALRDLGILAGDQHLIQLEEACLALAKKEEEGNLPAKKTSHGPIVELDTN